MIFNYISLNESFVCFVLEEKNFSSVFKRGQSPLSNNKIENVTKTITSCLKNGKFFFEKRVYFDHSKNTKEKLI